MNDERDLTRREVARLAGGIAATAGLAASVAPLLCSASAASDQLPFAVIGTGEQGRFLLTRFNRIASGRCAAVCDVNEASLRKATAIPAIRPHAYSDYRQVLDRKDIQAVVIATPLYMHFPILRDALLAGKHVFCENPVAFKPEEVRALRELASSRSSQIIQAGLQRRYSQFYQTAKQMVAKGLLGEVTDIYAQWHRASAWPLKPGTRQENWRLYREFSGGAVAEMAAPQIDLASWMFAAMPEVVMGMSGADTRGDGRDVHDNVSLIFRYPARQKLICSSISSNAHLPLFGSTRREAGEMLMGTEGTLEITLGNDQQPTFGLWFYEPAPVRISKAADAKEIARVAGASVASTGRSSKGLPILLARDQYSGEESFLEREVKFARRWLYSKGVTAPREDQNAADAQLAGFLECCKTGKRPRAHAEAGLENATSVILANLAVDEERPVQFSEFEKLGRNTKRRAG